MSDSALFTVIAVGSLVIVGIAVTGFVIFSRFLKKEKERGDRFGEIRVPPDERI